jgi:CRISPR-associated exonuclease Cas4
MSNEDDSIAVSALQHFVYCERRAALIFLERIWEDNVFTAEGSQLHKKAHESSAEKRGDVRIVRGLALASRKLGLVGKSDVVEFHRAGEGCAGAAVEGWSGRWIPFPVEYKRGGRRRELSFEVQLCAEAMCLEEMLGVAVPAGAIFYGKTARRMAVTFDDGLRLQTRRAAEGLRALLHKGMTPAPHYSPKCDKCSLAPVCMPRALSGGGASGGYLETLFESLEQDDETSS